MADQDATNWDRFWVVVERDSPAVYGVAGLELHGGVEHGLPATISATVSGPILNAIVGAEVHPAAEQTSARWTNAGGSSGGRFVC